MINDIGIRIKRRREALEMSQEELAIKVGYKSRSSINKIELGERDLTQKKIMLFAKALGTTPSYLMGWDDEDNNIPTATNIIPLPQTKVIPLLGDIACGEPILAEENIDDYIKIDKDIPADFALRCKGDSMINARIFDGDIVYIRQQPDVENGEIAAVLIDNEATLKRVYKYPHRIELRAENPTVKTFEFSDDEMNNIHILGKAVAFTSIIR